MDAQENAFKLLKEIFITALILHISNSNDPFRLKCDASNFATGAVLSQRGEDGEIHPVAFYSKTLNYAERNYEIYDKEFLVIIQALEEWRHYLEGLPETFTVISDHKNLEYWTRAQNLTRRQARWSLWLS